MNKLYVISKPDLKKLATKGKLSNNRSFSVLDGEELDLEKLANDNLSDNRSFAVLNKAELDSGERVKPVRHHATIHLYFAMLYLGLFIGFLIALMAVNMPSRKHTVFIIGTILFGAISLALFIWWWMRNYKDIQPQPTYTYDDVIQID
jgi:hypothetical protein